ncbi:MAG: M42 family peptidase [Eubacteriales bacterium]|nr:M42 family peptidase [Eubacteriales bacterium]
MNTVDLLKQLTTPVGVSGDEWEISSVVAELLAEYGEVSVDALNNVYCTFGKGYHFLLDAHIDEIGMVVKGISDDGFVKVDKCGGIDRRMLLASEVVVLGKERLPGIVSTLSPHLQKNDEDKKAVEFYDVSIDIGLSRTEAEQLVSPGDRVVFKRNFTPLMGNQISASVLDDRSGVAAIILALDMLRDIDAKITVMFSSQEEVGTRGAKVGPYSKNIDEAIVVDVSFGYTPFCKRSDCGDLGKGPMIGFAPILDRGISEFLVSVAKKCDIPYQVEVMGGGRTGTNADVISINRYGIRTGLISIPEKYMHSPIEVVDTTDVENTAVLIAQYIRHKVGDIDA